ncbi:hypothetical protein TNCV_2069581 [Trichonephila clavipes]|uniref:Uncharacterized protein n=1 Tax=Trichonephila clavipes TaxID=2585209 RepID=A0A8X6W2Y8_TRICX|nr:hypothetical protein TNCV_2069581 [Trichonephila clavipes]
MGLSSVARIEHYAENFKEQLPEMMSPTSALSLKTFRHKPFRRTKRLDKARKQATRVHKRRASHSLPMAAGWKAP